jgi:Fic family protein
MVYRNNEPYNDLPLLPPPATIETARVLRRCITASRALAELKGAGNLIPNQSILINSIPLQEARLSSEIENIVTTQDALFRAAVEEPNRTDPRTREVLRYRTALRHGFDTLQSRPIGIDLMLELCAILHDEPTMLRPGADPHRGRTCPSCRLYTPVRPFADCGAAA